MKYNTIYYFGVGHLHNNYVGVDGGSNIRLPLMMEMMKQGFKIKWIGYSNPKTFKNHYLDLFKIERFNIDLRDRIPTVIDIKEDGILFIELRPNIQKPGYNFEEQWNKQLELINTFHSKKLPVFVWDQDCWAQQLPKEILEKVILLVPYKMNVVGARQEEFHYSTICNSTRNIIHDHKIFDVVYAGNVYGRRDEFLRFFKEFDNDDTKVLVTGNWLRKDNGDRDFSLDNFPHFIWIGASEHWSTIPLLRKSAFTIQVNNPDQQKFGLPTVRLFEAHMAGCLPITNASIVGIDEFVPTELLAKDSADAYRIYKEFSGIQNRNKWNQVWKKFDEKMVKHSTPNRVKQFIGLVNKYD